jgi:predicted Rossmann fold flavoprotein
VTDSSPNTLRNILRSWPLEQQITFFEQQLGLPLVEEEHSGKLFPRSNRARDVRDGLLELAARKGVQFRPNTVVTGLSRAGSSWRVEQSGEETFQADGVVVASGGLSVPNTGSDGLGLGILSKLGHTVHQTYPALTPVVADPAPFGHLAGVSVTVTIIARDAPRTSAATGGFLFTHRGYSGPSVLDVSHVITRSQLEGEAAAQLTVQWTALDDRGWEAALRPEGTRTVAGVLRRNLPDRLADTLADLAEVSGTRELAQLTRQERRRLVDVLVRGQLPWTGDEGYKKAEVTGGGVSLAEIDPRTMESKIHPGLFLCGEVLDAFGPIGGYNFLWAWATGRAAGRAAGGRMTGPERSPKRHPQA